MKILVTGAAGYIGSHICHALINSNHEVIALDNLSFGKMENLNSLIGRPNFKFWHESVNNKELVLDGIDCIIHLACCKKVVADINPMLDIDTNILGTLNLINLARKYGVKRFVHSSTGSVYGNCNVMFEGAITEPVSNYGISKLCGESYVRINAEHVETYALRYFHVYGGKWSIARNHIGVIHKWINKILKNEPIVINGNGKQIRCFTHVNDIVLANINCMNRKYDGFEAFNVCSGIKISLLQTLRHIEDIIYRKVNVVYEDSVVGDIFDFNVINDKSINKLGLLYRKDFKEELEKLIKEAQEYDLLL